MRLQDLVSGIEVRRAVPGRSAPDVRICDITEDSRTVMPGSLYVARRGASSDGRQFVRTAVSAGAAAVLMEDAADAGQFMAQAGQAPVLLTRDLGLALPRLAERFYGNPSSRLVLIGVTGTNGKTTITYLIHQMLNSLGIRCGLIGTVMIDDGVEAAPASMTTPPALEISRTLARMLEAGCVAAVLEVSSHSLAQRRVAGLSFDIGVFTNLTGDHLDYHKTMESYADAKAMLFEMIPPAEAGGTAILNADDPASQRMRRDCRARVWLTSARPIGADTSSRPDACVARVTCATRYGSEAMLVAPWATGSSQRSACMVVPMVGGHNVMNALQAASAVAAVLDGSVRKGISRPASATGGDLGSEVLVALAACSAPPGRLECLTSPSDPITVYVDYAHTDDALRTVLDVLRTAMQGGDQTLKARRPGASPSLSVVFGCGGDRDATKRPRMGAVAAELAGRVYVTSDNPRTEDPRTIIQQVVSGMPPGAASEVTIEPDRERAIVRAVREARSGDVVLIAGKGHEDYQILPAGPVNAQGRADGTVTRSFDDRLVAGEALRLRGIAPRLPGPISRTAPASRP